MIYTQDNLKYCLALTADAFASWRDELPDGFRTHSLSLAGTASAPRYSAVMVKSDPPFAGRSSLRLSKQELMAKIAEMAKHDPPLHPYIITATGVPADTVYAASFRRAAAAPLVWPELSAADVQEVNKAQRDAGKILLSLDAFGNAAFVRYCAVWGDNPGRVAWNGDAVNEIGAAALQTHEAMTSVGARPALIALTPAGGLARLYVDTMLNHRGSMKPSMTLATMKAVISAEAAIGRFPVRIASATVDGALRFAALFARSDEIVQREFRMSDTPPVGLNATEQAKADGIDAWMKQYVTTNNIRGAAVAIVDGTRLVYAKGYTFAEPANLYPDIEPTTLFRTASVSKVFCAVAVWKALAADPKVTKYTAMQEVLALPAADDPVTFGKIAIRHLLESNSGIRQSSVGNIVDEVRAGGGKQPLTAPEIANAIPPRPMMGPPGGFNGRTSKRNTQYGKTDYFLLGLVAAKLAGAADFDSAVEKLVLEPLGMKHTRGSRSKAEDRQSDEAQHHLPGLETGESAVHSDRRIVAYQYGFGNWEIYDGAGGISSSVVDLARLCAMFSCRTNNPVLSAAAIDAMMSSAVAATDAGTDKGYYGFDKASYQGVPGNTVYFEKGGDIPGTGAGISGTTGKRFVVIFRNGEKVAGTVTDWKTDIMAIANAVDWSEDDLFSLKYGMGTLAA